jgi:hypothetical protein
MPNADLMRLLAEGEDREDCRDDRADGGNKRGYRGELGREEKRHGEGYALPPALRVSLPGSGRWRGPHLWQLAFLDLPLEGLGAGGAQDQAAEAVAGGAAVPASGAHAHGAGAGLTGEG